MDLDARYLSLTTFRRDGTPVATPVWFAPLEDGRLAVMTDAAAGKCRRLRADPRCTVAPCDARGRVRGEPEEARGEVVDGAAAMQPGLAVLRARYGGQWTAFNLLGRLRGRPDHAGRAVILITVGD